MRKEGFGKRLLSVLLALVMIVGILPASVWAAEEDTDYLFFATDRHTNTSIIGNIINNMESVIGEDELEYLGLGGDMVGSGNSHPTYNSSTVLGEATGATSSLSATNVDIVAGIHDMNVTDDAGIVLDYQGGGAQIYEGDKYYVYGVEEYCISDDSTESYWSSEAEKFVTWANGSTIDKSKVIIVLSHYPLHAKRNDNDGAYYWHKALNEVATGSETGTTVERNVIFFHGHNHTVDSNEYCYNVGDSMSIQNGSSTTTGTIYYTYATAGYLNANNHATLMAITDSTITLTRYGTSGSGTAMTTVERVSTVTPTTLAVTGVTEYTVGDSLQNPTSIVVTYSDGTTKTLENDSLTPVVAGTAELNNGVFTTAGTYTVTYNYTEGGKTASATLNVTVNPGLETVTYVDNLITIQATALGLTDINCVNVWGEPDLSGTFSDYVAYDVTLTGHTDGNQVFYSMLLVDGMDTTNLALYYVAEDNTLTAVPFELVTDEQGNQYVEFTTTYVGTFAYGAVTVPEGYTLTGIEVTNVTTTKYLVGGSLNMVNAVVTATYTNDAGEIFQCVIFDAYELSFDMTKVGPQTVTVSYTDGVTVSDTFEIEIFAKIFPDEETGVTAEVAVPGATAIVVTENTNDEMVKNAVANLLENYVSYDITLTGHNTGENVIITLPVPAGVDNPTVYHVTDAGVATQIPCTLSEDGATVSFTTNHFSTYVLGDGTTIETESGNATVEGSSTTTTEEKTVYVKVDAPVSGEQYLIVSTGTVGTAGYILGGSSVTPVSGTLTIDGTDGTYTYIESTGTLWTASGSGSSWSFANGSNYLGYTQSSSGNEYIGGLTYTYAVNTAGSSTAWTLNNNQLYIYLQSSTAGSLFGGSDSSANHYLTGGSSWSMDTTAANVYFYQKVTATVTTTTGTEAGAYSTVGTDIENAVAISGDTVSLSSALYWTPEGGSQSAVTDTTGITITYEVVTTKGNPNVISGISGSTATLSGVVGTAVVKVTYTYGDLTAWDEFIVTAGAPAYTVAIKDAEGNEYGENAEAKWNTSLDLSGTDVTYVNSDGETVTVSGADINWTVTDSNNDADLATVEGGVVTFGNVSGTVTLTATWTDSTTGTVYTDTLTVDVIDAVYALDLVDGTTKESITETIVIKGVTSSTTASVWAVITADGVDIGDVEDDKIVWTSSDTSIATVDPATGVITFTGKDGTVNITAAYEYTTGKSVTDTVTFSVTASNYSVPSDGTSDFPEYPNEGAVRFDKTATAVGNFSETGITQVELSMTGVPYTTNNAMDVVVMLDMTGSMSDNGMSAAEEATVAFVEKIVKNEDGTYNSNRVAVYAFNSGSSSPYELVSLKSITSDAELTTANTAIRTASDKQTSGGTPFDEAAQKCHDVLAAAKTDGTGNNRQQFCVFMSDGGPTSYEGSDGYTYYGGNNSSGDRKITSYIGGYTSSTSSSWTYSLPTEYWTDDMKADGVTVYTVGLLLQTAPSNPAPYSSMTDSTYDSTTDSLTSIGSHYYFTSTILKNMASDESKYIDIFSVDNADNATAKFTAIAQSILEAAKNVVVQDKISDDYTMVFDIPTGSYEDNNENVADALADQEFYIEFVEYALDENHERTTETSLLKLYLGIDDNGNYYAASDNSGTKFADPVFTEVTDEDTKAYWSIVTSGTAADGEIVINVNGTYYKFIADGSGDYNMTSGAYAYGTIDGTTSTSQDLVIITPYFAYSAATRMLAWTVDKLTTTEYALRYFLFLDRSSTDIGEDTEVDAGPYQTNDWATITYTNFNGNDCQQEFPVPQMTWNGAQVSYVFYLVNANGQPINKSGQVVDFANATFVTDVFTEVVVWNTATGEGDKELNVNYLANGLLPDAYTIFDENAEYTIHVYQDAAGNSVFDYFIIDGSDSGLTSYTTTKVYNTKAGTKYADYGTYSAGAVGTNFETTDASGNSVTITTTKQASLDYSDTTVAFAVVWEPKLVEDTVVVDFGLDVLINVVQNDNLQNTVSGIGVGNDAYVSANVEMNEGVSTTSKLGTAALTLDGNTISIENENQIRFHQGDMTFEAPVTFYYESPVEFYEGSEKQEGYMYSSVTVIPATTIYYEDSFVDLATTGTAEWETVGTEKNATQDQDRPGASQISADLDADNVYGYDSAYTANSEYSMGSARKVTVSSGNAGRASFTFYGTGFDVIALTSNTTGAIFVKVYSVADDGTKTEVKSLTVDTYYGYTKNGDEWVLSENTPNSLYQVPVMKVEGLTYGKYYVTITATYQSLFDHNTTTATDETTGETTTVKSGSYDFYLDAIRIYDPTGNQDDTANNAYVADGEGWPQYTELRNNVIDTNGFVINDDGTVSFPNDKVTGAIFIDSNNANTSIADYVSYGPNNELYLAAGQSVAFKLDQTYASIIADVQIALKVGNGGTVSYKIYDAGKTTAADTVAKTLNTATDLYYSIKDLSSGTIVITNSGESGILSITNIKVTYTQNPYGTSASGLDELEDPNGGIMLTSLYMDEVGANSAVMSLRSAPAQEEESGSEDVETEIPEESTGSDEVEVPETEEDEPEVSEPENGETESETPEVSEPEPEEEEPETPEVEEPEAEENKPETPEVEENESEETESESFFDKIGNFFKKLFGWLFG